MNHQTKIIPYAELAAWRASYNGPRPLVATSGCYDFLHTGHAVDLEKIRNLGAALIVGINDDESVRRYKGPLRPIVPDDQRAAILALLQCVDFVTVFPEDNPAEFIRRSRPDIYTKGSDWSIDKLPQADKDAIAEVGCELKFTQRSIVGASTTNIVKRVGEIWAKENCLQIGAP